MDIEFPYIPCYILSLDVQDVVGTHVIDLDGDLIKNRIDSNGKIVESIDHDHKILDNKQNVQNAMLAVDNQEGCRLTGYVTVNKVSGNFHLSSHSYQMTA